jgi:hypothetical protein
MAHPPRQEEQMIGAVAGDRPLAFYTPVRDPVTYGRSAYWIAGLILAALFALFFGIIFLWH